MTVPTPQSVVTLERAEYERLIGVAEDLISNTQDPGTEALAAVYCARRILDAPAPSSLAGGEEAEFATALARVLDRHGLKDAGWAAADIDEALSVVREPSAVSRATVDAILPMISERIAALSPEAPAREGERVGRLSEALIRMIEHFERVDAPEADKAVIEYASKAWAGVDDATGKDGSLRGAEWFGVTGATDETEALAVALFDARCPGIRMTDEDLHYYRVAAQRAMQAVADELDTPTLTPRHEAPAEGAGEDSPITAAIRAKLAKVKATDYHPGTPAERMKEGKLDGLNTALAIAMVEDERAIRARSSAPEAREGEAVAWRVQVRGDGKWNLWDSDPLDDDCLGGGDRDRFTVQPLYVHPAAPSADKLRTRNLWWNADDWETTFSDIEDAYEAATGGYGIGVARLGRATEHDAVWAVCIDCDTTGDGEADDREIRLFATEDEARQALAALKAEGAK